MPTRSRASSWLRTLLVLACAAAGATWPARSGASEASGRPIYRDIENPLGNEWILKIQSQTYLLEVADFDTHRLATVTSPGTISSASSTKTVSPGGSSSVLSSAGACTAARCTSSTMIT